MAFDELTLPANGTQIAAVLNPIIQAANAGGLGGGGGNSTGPQGFDTLDLLLADTVLSYSNGAGQVEAGQVVWAGTYAYEVQASGATDHHLLTAGGVKLRVLPGAGGAYNVKAFGGDIQKAVNAASYGVGRVVIPGGTYSLAALYLQYDAALNPGFNPSARAQGRLVIEGAGQCDDGQAITGTWGESGTSLVFSGAGLVASSASSPYPIRALVLRHLTLVGNSTGPVVDFASVHTGSALEWVTVVQQNAAGDGVRWLDSWEINVKGVRIINTANAGSFSGTATITGRGLTIKNPTVAGGQFNLDQVTAQAFKTGFQLGEPDYTASAQSVTQISYTGVQALKCDTGYDIGKGVADMDGSNLRCENCVTRGIYVHAYARGIFLHGRFTNASATEADIVIGGTSGDDLEDTVLNVAVLDSTLPRINAAGIKFNPTANSVGLRAQGNRFVANVAGVGTGIVTPESLLKAVRANAPEVAANRFTSLAANATGPRINPRAAARRLPLKNADFALDSDANGTPDNWTLYSGTGSLGTGVDSYGSGSSYKGSNGSGTDAPLYQVITFPAQTMLRLRYWVKSIASATTYRVRLTDAAGSSPTISDLDTTAPTSTAEERTVHWFSGANTSARLELRGAEFGRIEIDDVSSE